MNKEQAVKLINSTKSWTYACAPMKIAYGYGFILGFLKAKKHYSEYLNEAFYPIRDSVGIQWTDTEQNYRNIEQLYKDPEQTRKYIATWLKEKEQFYAYSERLMKALRKLDDEEFAESFKDYIDYMAETWAKPLATDMMGIYTEVTLLKSFTDALSGNMKAKAHELFSSLCKPSDISFITAEHISLLKLAELHLKKDKIFDKELTRHQENYFWIENSYNLIKILDKEYFRKKVQEESSKGIIAIRNEIKLLLDRDAVSAKQNKIFKELNLPENIMEDLIMTQKLGMWLDHRKEFCLKSIYYQYEFMKEMCRRRNYAFDDLEQLSCSEMLKLFIDKKPLPQEIIDSRRKLAVYVGEQPDKEIIFHGKDAEDIANAFEMKTKAGKEETLKGLVASKGTLKKYRGVARIILDPSKAEFSQGDILVASMTRPEYVPLMKKALAIVTDEGGITSHAAIISRELGIPCIIGTRFATKLLKNNDEIEMDMEKGSIKRV